ncbi:MAG: hypothetical protein FWH36_07190 [Lentimicrobiaceae bacterium]|nr:hypothetical protein [Lentimicrobiaceae bacterium]
MKRLKPIKEATQFSVDYCNCNDYTMHSRFFNSFKSMEQWVTRNDKLNLMIIRRSAKINNEWDSITTIGKQILTLSQLKKIVRQLEDDILSIEQIKNRKNQ